MSASVFKPINLEMTREIAKMRPPVHSLDRRSCVLRNGMGRVRRALFGPINHVETQRFLEEELARKATNDADKWQFNFRSGKPLELVVETRYVWKAVAPPILKDLSYAPVRRPEVIEEDNADCYPSHLDARSEDIAELLTMETAEDAVGVPGPAAAPVVSSSSSGGPSATSTVMKTVQRRMTDFMQVRKRSAESAFVKKVTAAVSGPPKLKMSRSSNNLGS